ncbi:MAG TPA: GIY-YIG nuclease family protein [Verrucomicrobiae bacterium]|nr:GIY-YIG nuclease family protein [Verrucomicrobiae bacterium]
MGNRRNPFTERVTVVNKRTIGGGWSLRDLFVVPVSILIPFHLAVLIFKKWPYVVCSLLFLYTLITTNLAFAILATITGVLLGNSIRVLRLYRQHSTIPLAGIIRGFRYIIRFRKQWHKAATRSKLGIRTPSSFITPKIRSLEIGDSTGHSVRAYIDLGKAAQTVEDLEKAQERICSIMYAQSATTSYIAPGEAEFHISWLPSTVSSRPTAQDPWLTSPEQRRLPVMDLNSPPTGRAHIDLGRSVLIGGETGTGKSNLIWDMLRQLNQQEIDYDLIVIDPSGGVELEELRDGVHTRKYADTPQKADEAIKIFIQQMFKRLDWMKNNKTRRHIPTKEHPFTILIVDELINCPILFKGKVGQDNLLAQAISMGRKAGFVVWANSQLGQKDVVTHIRDLFPQRVCFGTHSDDLTDSVLGTGATTHGATCHLLREPGVGYVWTNQFNAYERFRSPLITNTRSIAQGGLQVLPESPTRRKFRRQPSTGPTYVYQLFDSLSASEPVYVGITDNINRRFREHSKDKEWFPSVIHQRTLVHLYPTRLEAKAQESALIDSFQPKYNVQERTPLS